MNFSLALLSLLHGKRPNASVEEVTGVSISEMEEMLALMKGCKFGAIYVGLGIASSYGKHRNAELAFNLVKELNGYTKFVVIPGVIDAMESDGTFYRLDDVPIYFQPFTNSPFSYTESNEDTMKQIFARVKEIRRK